jgi:multidrug resistance efflux pump
MGRLERRIFKLNDEIRRLEAELRQARAELDNHRSLADDAARDAAVHDTPFDREDLRETTADVARFERLVDHFTAKIEATITTRDRLMEKLD